MLHAVAVGINKYADTRISALSYARSDAQAVADLLEAAVHPSELNLHLFLDQEATKKNLMAAIGEQLPRAAGVGDLVLIYFACHGTPETTQSTDQTSRYLVAHDTEYDQIYATGLDLERELPRWCERIIHSQVIVLILDSCFSGRAGGRTFEGPRHREFRSHFRHLEQVSLRDLDLGEGRVMLSACDDNQVAYEEHSLRHGVFTHYLLEELKSSNGGVGKTVSIGSLYESVASDVRAHTCGKQTPVLNGRSRMAKLPRLG